MLKAIFNVISDIGPGRPWIRYGCVRPDGTLQGDYVDRFGRSLYGNGELVQVLGYAGSSEPTREHVALCNISKDPMTYFEIPLVQFMEDFALSPEEEFGQQGTVLYDLHLRITQLHTLLDNGEYENGGVKEAYEEELEMSEGMVSFFEPVVRAALAPRPDADVLKRPECVLFQCGPESAPVAADYRRALYLLAAGDFSAELDVVRVEGEASYAAGYITESANDRLSYRIGPGTPFYRGICDVLNDVSKETADDMYDICGVRVLLLNASAGKEARLNALFLGDGAKDENSKEE